LRIYAEQGTASIDKRRGVTFTLEHGHLAKIDPTDPSRWLHSTFGSYVLSIPFNNDTKTAEKSLEELDNGQLSARMHELRARHIPFPLIAVQQHLRWAVAMTPLLFVMLGVPLAIRVHRGGRSIGFIISLGVLMIYYVLLMGGIYLGQRGVWPPILAVWSANVILLGAGLFLMRRFMRQ
jgi:lipopolysaccharide export system permease protein